MTTPAATHGFSNLHLITNLILQGFNVIDVIDDDEDPRHKSLAIFEKTAELVKAVENFHEDVPLLISPRTYEKTFKDTKFLMNSTLLKRKQERMI